MDIAVEEIVPSALLQRINHRNKSQTNKSSRARNTNYVLYLPTVVLRKEHNPAFALACSLANAYQVPLIVLAVVLDDFHLPLTSSSSSSSSKTHDPKPVVVFTARRIAFVLEALQQATLEWQAHGAGVAVRVHGPQCRTPHHLTLAARAAAVVTDEPFVHPYRAFVDSIERTLSTDTTTTTIVPFYSVDGSTTVPPISKLRNNNVQVPHKAWKWNELTKPFRQWHVSAVVKEGQLDAPDLIHKLQDGFFLNQEDPLFRWMPKEWKDASSPCPGKRPWSSWELGSIPDLKQWVMQWPGIDRTVSPCVQTHGSGRAGMQRWKRFVSNHLKNYAKCRNTITVPNAVSRMSCYLNYGVVSIFNVVQDVWNQKSGSSYKGASKFEEEVVKWREMGYAHAFGSPGYNQSSSVPAWASKWMALQKSGTSSFASTCYSLTTLETGQTADPIWNAMQHYLVETGELHNNARMSWGKTVVHWQKHHLDLEELLQQLVYLNDRYALDGLSPPSYAGLLWCLGWCDKPVGNNRALLSEKPASNYRTGPDGFKKAQQALLASVPLIPDPTVSLPVSPEVLPTSQKQSHKRVHSASNASLSKRQKLIDSYIFK